MKRQITCPVCGVSFEATHPLRVTCSHECSIAWAKTPRYKRAEMFGIEYDKGVTLEKLIERDGLTCRICGLPCLDKNERRSPTDILGATIDHIKPLSTGGTHTWDNVQIAHFLCNVNKRDEADVLCRQAPKGLRERIRKEYKEREITARYKQPKSRAGADPGKVTPTQNDRGIASDKENSIMCKLVYDDGLASRRLDAYTRFLLEAYDTDLEGLANVAAISKEEIEAYQASEYGEKSAGVIQKLANLTGISPAWLFAEKSEGAADRVAVVDVTGRLRRLDAAIRKLEGVEYVIRVLSEEGTEQVNALLNQAAALDDVYGELREMADELEAGVF